MTTHLSIITRLSHIYCLFVCSARSQQNIFDCLRSVGAFTIFLPIICCTLILFPDTIFCSFSLVHSCAFFVTMTTRCCLLFGVEILMDSDDYAIANAIFFSSITKHARSFLFARTFVAIDLQKKERFFAHLYRYHRFLFPLSLHLCNIFACCWLGCYHTHIFGDIRFL